MPALRVLIVFALLTVPAVAQDMPLSDVLLPDEPWRLVTDAAKGAGSLASDSAGHVYYNETFRKQVLRIDARSGAVTEFLSTAKDAWEIAIGPDDALYVSQSQLKGLKITTDQILKRAKSGATETAWAGPELASLCALTIARDGSLYFTTDEPKRIYRARPGESPEVAAETTAVRPQGIVVWPDGGTLVAADAESRWLRAFRVQADGRLADGSDYYGPLQKPSGAEFPEPYAMALDEAGRLYAATAGGVQMFDPTGRLGGTILLPAGAGQPLSVCFGGADRKSLFAVTENRVYRRTVKPAGAK